jgi:hypothetical protein
MDLPHLALRLRIMELYLHMTIRLHGVMFNQLSPGTTLPLPSLWDMVDHNIIFVTMDRQWTHFARFLPHGIPNVSGLWKAYVWDGLTCRYWNHMSTSNGRFAGVTQLSIPYREMVIELLEIFGRSKQKSQGWPFVSFIMDKLWIMKTLERVREILLDRW